MAYSALADAVVIVHFGFIAFVALGGFLAWRWRWLMWSHIGAVTWAVGIVTVGYDCPLTPLEKHLRRLAGERGYTEGFVDRYIEGVIYPERYTSLVRMAIAAAVVVAWAGLAMLHGRGDGSASGDSAGSGTARTVLDRAFGLGAPVRTRALDAQRRALSHASGRGGALNDSPGGREKVRSSSTRRSP